MQKAQMNYLVQHFSAHQNETLKLNSGQMREAISLVMQGFANWLTIESFDTYKISKDLYKGENMAKKKASKKAKPATKPTKKGY